MPDLGVGDGSEWVEVHQLDLVLPQPDDVEDVVFGLKSVLDEFPEEGLDVVDDRLPVGSDVVVKLSRVPLAEADCGSVKAINILFSFIIT